MFNADKLRGKMVEKRCTAERMANYLGIDPATFHRKMNGKSEFNRSEIQRIATFLNLTIYEVKDIFFADELA